MVEHSIFSWFGASVRIRSSFPTATWWRSTSAGTETGLSKDLAFGIRARLPLGIAGVSRSDRSSVHSREPASLNLARYREVDPYETHCHTAMALVDQCDRMMLKGDFMAARENCNQALLLAPGYAKALRMRGNVSREFVGAQGGNLPTDRKLELLAKAYQDIQQYRDAVPATLGARSTPVGRRFGSIACVRGIRPILKPSRC